MTYAGIKSMIYCGVSKDDPRMKKAYEWITEELHRGRKPRHAVASRKNGACTTTTTPWPSASMRWGSTRWSDADGKKHDWRADITAALAKRQRADGSWVNNNHWMECDPNLVTGYALMALSYCKPKSK